MRKDAVDATANTAQLGHRRLLDGDATGKVLVAVQKTGRAIQGVPGVIDGRTLLGGLVSCALNQKEIDT